MVRKLLLAALTLCVCTVATAGPISLRQAKAIAKQYAKASHEGPLHAPQAADMQLVELRTSAQPVGETADYPLYYVFDRPGGEGFVIVAGDDRMRPVLATTDSGSFDPATANPGLRWWLDAVAETAERIAQSADESPRYVQTKLTGAVEPLIQTQWGQNAPYNLLCPTMLDERCVTGCVATAMAQVFYYLRYPSKASGQVSYENRVTYNGVDCTETLSANLGDYSFDYSKMLLSYSSDDTSEAAQEVAKLMYACGMASEMQYSPVASGSNIKKKALTENFGLDKSCKQAERAEYSDEEWEAILRGELEEGRPVFYSGADKDGNGHQFICDGYDTEGLFHINWGWSGYQDGYFDLSAIQYCERQEIVYNLKPDEGGESNVLNELRVDGIALNGNTAPYEVTLGSYLSLKIDKICPSFSDFSGYAGIGLYRGDEPVAVRFYGPNRLFSIEINRYTSLTCGITIPSNLSNGVYTLRPVAGLTTTDYSRVRRAVDSEESPYLILNVVDGKAIVTDCMKTIPEAGFATFSAFANTVVPEGVTAYKARMNDSNTKVLLYAIEGNVIPANTGVVLRRDKGGKYLLDLTDEAASGSFADNELIATTLQPTVPAEGKYFALKAGTNTFASLKNGLDLSVGKAYIKALTDSDVKSIPFTLDDEESTAIESIRTSAPALDGDYYTVQGIRVERPSHGLYIHNGKKIFIK